MIWTKIKSTDSITPKFSYCAKNNFFLDFLSANYTNCKVRCAKSIHRYTQPWKSLIKGEGGGGELSKMNTLAFYYCVLICIEYFHMTKIIRERNVQRVCHKKPKHWSHVSGLRFCVLGRGFFYPGSSVLGFESQVLGPGSWRSYYKVCQEVITKCDRPRIVWKLLRSE